MDHIIKGCASTRFPVSRSASSEKVANHPTAPNTEHDNRLGDYYEPIYDGPGPCALKKIKPLSDLNTEADE